MMGPGGFFPSVPPLESFQPPTFQPPPPPMFMGPRGGVLQQLARQMRRWRRDQEDGAGRFRSMMPFRLAALMGFWDPFSMPGFGRGLGRGDETPGQRGPAPPMQTAPEPQYEEEEPPRMEQPEEEFEEGREDFTSRRTGKVTTSSGGTSSGGGLTKTDLDKGYKAGVLSAEDYVQGLIDYGMSPEDASLRSQIYGPESESASVSSGRATGLNLTDLRKGFKAGQITYEDYVSTLVESKGKSPQDAIQMARSDMGLEGNFTRALAVSADKRNEWRKLYLARNKKIAPLKAPTPSQRMYADARAWAQKFKEESGGKGTLDGYLAYAYGKLANKYSPEDARDTLNAQPSVYSVAFTDAFQGKKAYVKEGTTAPKPAAKPKPSFKAQGGTQAERKKAVESGSRSFTSDKIQERFLKYKKAGGKYGPETYYERYIKTGLHKV